ncbi:T9SS type A sorting domain-containing protein [Bacteroidota bacterium]
MKKLILLFAGILLSGFMIGQSLSLTDDQGNPFSDGQTVYFIGEPSGGTVIYSYVHVTNNAGTALSVKVSRTEDFPLAGTTEQFCWGGACYPVGTAVSPLASIIDPGQTNIEFEGMFTHNDIFGEGQYTYTWFDENNPSDKVDLVVIYKLSNVGIAESLINQVEFSEAYPNPANSYVFFDFDIPATIENSSITITNLLGAVVKEIPVSGNSGKVKINTSDLDNGLYFGSLKVGNQIATTHRLVVNH